MKNIIILSLFLIALSGCSYTTPDGIYRSDAYPFGTTIERPFQDMVANAHQPDTTVGEVYFAYDQAGLTPMAKEQLQQIAGEINRRDGLVVVEGHADHMNTEPYNVRLGYKRAIAVANYLKSAGVWDERMTIHSFGESRPVATNWVSEGQAMNRRVVVKMFSQGDGLSGKEAINAKKNMLQGGESQESSNPMGQMMNELTGAGGSPGGGQGSY